MSALSPSAVLALSQDVRAALDNLALQEVLSQDVITGADVHRALGTLSCGCVRGQYLCPVAQALWDMVSTAWNNYQANRSDKTHTGKRRLLTAAEAWRQYLKARQAYDEHFT